MRVELFDFDLPEALIAQRPAVPRDRARLLDIGPDKLIDRTIADLPSLLREGDLLVFNDTRVLAARLRGIRPGSGARQDVAVELLLLRRQPDATWLAMARPARRLKAGDRLRFADGVEATIRNRGEGGAFTLGFDLDGPALGAALDRIGTIPLPPYIRGGVADPQDRNDYQTVYARSDGAVAAPTAGLHFTPELMAALSARGVRSAMVTLHIGSGTFQPVRVDDTDAHRMDSEWGEVGSATAQAIHACREAGGRIVAVGTTALRLLETVARQNDGNVVPWSGDTDLFIVPGYRFRVADLLLTNFHLPRSTLFMLVAAFAGLECMQQAYRHAIAAEYRFYSYGDACLLRRTSTT